MFVNSDYKNYKYVVAVSDNYIVLTNRRTVSGTWENQVTIPIIYQYLDPSFITIESERTYSSTQTFNEIETTDNFFERKDSLKIIEAQLLILLFFMIMINGITRLVKKGGLFFGN